MSLDRESFSINIPVRVMRAGTWESINLFELEPDEIRSFLHTRNNTWLIELIVMLINLDFFFERDSNG